MGLVEKILEGDEKSAARLISQVEDGKREAYRELSRLLPYTGKAHIIGITGPAGAGKSTLAGRLAVLFSQQGKKVGIIATDPTSIKGKGAFLGDRLRMKEAEKVDVFIRSMAHRAYPGGVARAASGAVYVLEGLGKNIILLESIGAGQSEKGLFFLCDTVITLFTPDYGDEIQLLKAGLIEIGDIIVINKADKQGAKDAERELKVASSEMSQSNGWKAPVILVEADKGQGMEELLAAIDVHWQTITNQQKREEKKKEKSEAFMMALLKEELWRKFTSVLSDNTRYREILDNMRSGKIDPYSAVEKILEELDGEWTLY